MSRAYFEHEITVLDEEIDDLGHVNNAVYLSYAEACARAHAEREGLTLERFKALGVVPVIRRHVITYHRPAGPGERLRVSTRVTKIGGPRAERLNQIRRAETGELLAEVVTEWVWLAPGTMRPKRVPREVMAAFGF